MGYRFRKSRKELDNIILQSLIKAGNVSVDKVLEDVMNKREEILRNHESHRSVWQGRKTKKWYTKLGPEETMIVRKKRSDLENAIVEYYLLKENLSATFDDVFRNLCEHMKEAGTHKGKTIDEYGYDYNRTIAGSDFAKMHMSEITEKDLIHFLKETVYHRKEKLPKKRFDACKTILRAVFNHAKLEMDIECISVKHVMDDLRFPSTAFKEEIIENDSQVFKISETTKIKTALTETDDLKELGILLALETGLRLGELCVLKREDISDTHLHVNHSEHKAKFDGKNRYFIGEPKKDKKRKVVLSKRAKSLATRILALHNSEWLFPSDKHEGSWMRSYCFDKTIRKVCRQCDIPVRSMHKLRKTYASYLLSQGIDEKIVQTQLGHADIITTRRCYHYNIWDTDQTIDILSDVVVG